MGIKSFVLTSTMHIKKKKICSNKEIKKYLNFSFFEFFYYIAYIVKKYGQSATPRSIPMQFFLLLLFLVCKNATFDTGPKLIGAKWANPHHSNA